jgi:D-3-phosphoglycerate dehydrogenase
MFKVLITTVPFGEKIDTPIQLLKEAGVSYVINPLGRKLKEDELAELITEFDAVIAGTEIISERVMDKAKSLKLISRVGVGLDGVDLMAAKKRGISVSYTPEAPAPAVAELTIALIMSLLRSVHLANIEMHRGEWRRHFGRRISEVTIGIIGVGRIGGLVAKKLTEFANPRILINDLYPNSNRLLETYGEWVSKEKIYLEADVISLHVPLTVQTKNMIREKQLFMMKKDAVIVNTARGGIINEEDLVKVMKFGQLSGVAIDVFNNEPYNGNLSSLDNCLLTSHMGSMSIDCRSQMEIEATQEVIRFFKGNPLQAVVPNNEYEIQFQGL